MRTRYRRRRAGAAIAVLVGCLLAASCGGGTEPNTPGSSTSTAAGTEAQTSGSGPADAGSGDSGAATQDDAGPAQDGGDLVIAGYQEMTTLDKDLAGTSNDALRVLENVLDRLYVLDSSAEPVPSLAAEHTLSDDKLTWTFTLRDDAKFSDGQPVTAADVVFSLDLARDGTLLGSLYSKIESITADGEHTVVIKTKSPEPVMLQLLTLETSGVIQDNYGGKSKDDYWGKPIGSGPWMFDAVTQGVGVKVVPNPHWWGEKGHLDSITVNTVADPNTRLIQLRSGQAQLIETPSFAQLPAIDAGNTMVATFPSTEVDFMVMNTSKPPLDDVHFRKAISLALDREAIVEAALRGHGEPAATWVSKEVLGGYEPAVGHKHDIEAAKAALAESATPDYSEPINLDFSKSSPTGWSQAAQVIQANLKEIGLDLQIHTVDTNTLQAGTADKTFDLHFGLLTYDIPDAGELIGYYFATDGYNSFLDMSATKELNDKAAAEFDPTKRLEMFKGVADKIVEDFATPGLYTVPYFWGASKSLHGFKVILTGQFSFNDLWLG